MLRNITSAFLVLLALSFFTTNAGAQSYDESVYQYKPISLGIVLTPNMGWLRYGDNDNFSGESRVGFGYGLQADFAFSENYYFNTGLLINTINSRSTLNNLRTDYRLQYAEIPLALKLKSTMRYFRSYYGLFGFSTGFKLSGREKADNASNSTSIGGDANLFRLALQVGGGVEWLLDHNLMLMTGLTYNNGFTRAIRPGEPQNSYFALNLGIIF